MKNIYLIKCNSYHLLNSILNNIIKDNENVTTFSLSSSTISDVIEDASYFGLFESNRIIIVKDTKYFGGKFNYEEESNAIKDFVDKLDELTTIIFICDNILKTKELTKYMISVGAEIIDKSDDLGDEISSVIKDYAKDNNIKISDGAVDLIIKNSSNNIDIALLEIDKLSNISTVIDEKIINQYGTTIESDETFDFIDAVVRRNFDLAFSLLDKLINNNTEILGLISLLANRFSTMYIVKSADIDHLNDDEIADMLGFKNKGRLYYIRKDGKFYTIDQLKSIIISLCDLDKLIKTGYNPVYAFKELLLNL